MRRCDLEVLEVLYMYDCKSEGPQPMLKSLQDSLSIWISRKGRTMCIEIRVSGIFDAGGRCGH